MNWLDLNFFTSGKDKDVSERIVKDLDAGKVVLPSVSNIMAALDYTSFDNVKVVILGQDPYPTKGHANGLAFSVSKNVSPLPKSLQNIYKELDTDVGVNRSSGDLTDWARQGVLLLNTTLTVIEGKPASHSAIGWSSLTKEIIERLNNEKTNLVFILWGKHAQDMCKDVDQTKHLVLKSAHPSPLSSYRGFFGSKPFSKTNEYLRSHNLQEISW